MDERWAEIRAIWKQHQWLYVVAGFLLGMLFQPFLATISTDLNGFLQAIVPEAIGIVFTVLLIDRIYQRREQAREERELKARLIRELGSKDNAITELAVKELRDRGWHNDGSLRGENLVSANLRGCNLAEFDLREAKLVDANLEYARLGNTNLSECELGAANLKHAILLYADLRGAHLTGADLQNVNLFSANLKEAWFDSAKLQGAKLNKANLESANFLVAAQYDDKTVMPDNTLYDLRQLNRFTDPAHPHFWRSDDPRSPAYRGKKEE